MLLHRTIILRCPLIFVGLDPSRSRIDDGFCVGYQRWNGLLRDADPFDLQALESQDKPHSRSRDPPMLD